MKRKEFMIITGIIICLLIGLLIWLFLTNNETDGKRFKEEYSYLNIDNNNPFIYKSANDIVEMINNKETFLVYFGYANNDKVKELLPIMIKAIQDEKIETVYYVDIENIRNVMEFSGNSVETVKMGTAGYYDLLKILDKLLPDYDLTDNKGKKIEAGKIINAPTLLAVSSGDAVKLSSGDGEDTYSLFKEVIDAAKPNKMCDEDTAC